jgi:hypothetical protein
MPNDGVVPEEDSKREAAAAAAGEGGALARRSARHNGSRIYEAAIKWVGTRYIRGGGDCNGPSRGGFDSSGM